MDHHPGGSPGNAPRGAIRVEMPTVTPQDREEAKRFASHCYDHFINGETSDLRQINAIIAEMAKTMADVAPPWNLTTMRYNEAVIRVSRPQEVEKHRSYLVDLNETAYNAPHDDEQAFVEEVSSWIIGAAERLAEAEERKLERVR